MESALTQIKPVKSSVWTPWGAQPIPQRESALASLQRAVRTFSESKNADLQAERS